MRVVAPPLADTQHLHAALRKLDRGPLAGRARADHEHAGGDTPPPTGVMRLRFGCAAAKRSTPASRQPAQAPLRGGDHRRATLLRSLNARAVLGRHLILVRLVDVADTARVRPSVTQGRMLGRIERTVLRVDAGTVIAVVALGHS
jgi:hypothetical protein